MIEILIYCFVWIVAFIFSLLDILNYKINKKFLIIFIFFLTMITGIRYFNGVDYGTYSSIFKGIKNINDYLYLEILFRLIIVFNNKILNYNYNFMTFSILNFIFLYFALKKIKYPFLGLFIYINLFWINYSFNGMRQGIAMNIFLFALLLPNIYFFILAILSTAIHKVSLFIFLISKIIFYVKRRIKYQNFIFMMCSVLVLIFSPKIIKILRPIIYKLDMYSASYNYFNISGLFFRIISIIIFIFFEKKINKDIFYKKIFNIYLFSFFEYLLLFNSYMFGTRINMFFRIIEVILYSQIFQYTKDRNKKIVLFLFLSIFWGSVYCKEIFSSDNSPYKINPYFVQIYKKNPWIKR